MKSVLYKVRRQVLNQAQALIWVKVPNRAWHQVMDQAQSQVWGEVGRNVLRDLGDSL